MQSYFRAGAITHVTAISECLNTPVPIDVLFALGFFSSTELPAVAYLNITAEVRHWT